MAISVSPSPTDTENPETISAEELHSILLRAHRLGARVRMRFLKALLALHRTRLYLELGFSSTIQYAARYFGYRKSQTYDSLRVAESLERLPRASESFEEGSVSWSALREVTRVAQPETEEAWLDVAGKKTIQEVQAEVQDAIQNNRKAPRKGRYGLPKLNVRLEFSLQPQEHAVVKQALEAIAAEMRESLGDASVRPHEALVHLATRFLEGQLHEAPPDGEEGKRSLYTILYRVCPDCRRSHVATEAGFVEIDEEAASRVEHEAEKTEITPVSEVAQSEAAQSEVTEPDGPESEPVESEEGGEGKDRPNPPALVRRVRLRDGNICANPDCGCRQGLQAHHLKFRSQGGRTELWNEVLLCPRCHALIHQGLLEVHGDPAGELQWKPAAEKIDTSDLELAEERRELADVPVVQAPKPVPVSAGGFSTIVESAETSSSGAVSTIVESFPFSPGQAARRFPAAVRALEKLGYTRTQARERIARAWEEVVREESARENPEGNDEENVDQDSPTQDHDLEQSLLNRALRLGQSTTTSQASI